VVYRASSSVSGLNTSTCTAGSEAHHGEVEASSDDDARGGGVARGRRGARRDATLARADEPLLAAHARVVDIAAGPDVQRGARQNDNARVTSAESDTCFLRC
jgi:hypothetical protein